MISFGDKRRLEFFKKHVFVKKLNHLVPILAAAKLEEILPAVMSAYIEIPDIALMRLHRADQDNESQHGRAKYAR